MKAYAWNGINQGKNIIPMSWVYQEATETPLQAATRVAHEFSKCQIGDRTLTIVNPFGSKCFDISNFPDFIIHFKVRYIQPGIAWLSDFFTDLRNAGQKIDRIILDDERGINIWSLALNAGKSLSEAIAPIYAAPLAKMALPVNVRIHQLADFDQLWYTRTGYDALLAWDQFATGFNFTVVKTLQNLASTVMGSVVRISNWEDYAYIPNGWWITDPNDWPIPIIECTDIASPDVYLTNMGWKYDQASTGLKKDMRWNVFLDMLNRIRSSRINREVSPWISDWAYVNDTVGYTAPDNGWLYRELIRHCAACGITTLQYWNPRGNVQADAFLDDILTEINENPIDQTAQLVPIQLDQDIVISGGVQSKYYDYCVAAGLPLPPINPY